MASWHDLLSQIPARCWLLCSNYAKELILLCWRDIPLSLGASHFLQRTLQVSLGVLKISCPISFASKPKNSLMAFCPKSTFCPLTMA
ncbi:hypothetical protein Csa_019153 [Cucumis sativus]|uniref:Uncharacterized protein n=1 Tax=Cucumis sativus TaxID=3659 RepID=A0A0A0KWE6_CUCSA|nr:hypothetical protein Csa_019153 [Cucumis sativus]